MRPFAEFPASCAFLAIFLLFVPLDRASQNPRTPPQIHVSTQLVQIGVIVRDSSGPVRNLTENDFVVLDGNARQKISVFSVESADSTVQPVPPLPQNTFSDSTQTAASKPRSVTIVLLDNLNTLTGSAPLPYETTPFWLEDQALANAKNHLIEFLKQLDPSDRLAIYGLTDSLHVLCDFTCDRDQLLAVVNRYDPSSKTQREAVESGQFSLPNVAPEFNEAIDADSAGLAALNNRARAQATMAALVAISSHVADIPGRKNLLWLTANLPFSGQAIARVLGRANIAAYPVDARGLLPRSPSISSEVEPAGGAQVRKALGLDAVPNQTDEPVGLDAMQKMAEETGGHAFINTNDLTGAIRKVVEDSSVTYTLGFYVPADALDGKFHELKVKVERSGVSLHYPRGYFALKDEQASQDERHNNFVTAMRSPLDSSSIPVQVQITRVEKPLPHCLSVSGLIDVHNLRIEHTPGSHKGVVEVATVEQDETGKVLRQSSSRIVLHFNDAQYATVMKSGFTFHQFVQPQAGATTLRFVVEDPATAQIGSLIVPLSRVN